MDTKKFQFKGTCINIILATLAASLIGCSGEGAKSPATAKETTQAAPAAPAPRQARQEADLETGKAIYGKYCHFCHGQRGTGDGPVGIAITPHPADFVNDTKRMSKSDEELFTSITKGVHRDIGGEEMAMPRWQDILTDKERWDVLGYIRYLEKEGRKAQGK